MCSQEDNFDYYDMILNFYKSSHYQDFSEKDIEIWKNQMVIFLMRHLEQTHEKTRIKNALILLLSLFENDPIDIYHNHGKTSKELSLKEKKQIVTILGQECA
ncbi:MAG: hypothetical protein EU541_00970 [Promethearchaeota archaeon]|nr:MAG: hypothetical protein EU541_00970 [Candidatus Lokiarchaeota archaeon]